MMKQDMTDLLARADAWIAEHKQEFLDELVAMTRIPSVSRADLAQENAPFGPDCQRMLDHALARGRAYGFDVQDYDGYAGAIMLGDSNHALGIVGHLDVVPVGDGWTYPPFGATYLPEHDAVVGRGADDNKGPVLRMLRDFGYPLKHGVTLLLGCSEETGMNDMKYLLQTGVTLPKTSLVPDSGFPVNYGQKGSVTAQIEAECEGNLLALSAGTVRNIVPDHAEAVLNMPETEVKRRLAPLREELLRCIQTEAMHEGTRIIAKGKPAHAAFPEGGINAIHLLCSALTQAALLEGSCSDAVRELMLLTEDAYGICEGAAFEDEESGKLTLVYGVAKLAGGKLSVSVDCRYPIHCDEPWLTATLHADWKRRGYRVTHLSASKPYYIPKTDPRIQGLQALFDEITGLQTEPFTMGGGTYSRVLPNAISFGAGMPGYWEKVQSFMPRGHGGAHAKDEVCLMEKVYNCARIYVAALALLDDLVD